MKLRHDFWIVKMLHFSIFLFFKSEIIVFVLLLFMLYCSINKLFLSVLLIIFFFNVVDVSIIFIMNFFLIFLFSKITIEQLLKYSFNVFNVFKNLTSFFIVFSFFVSLFRIFFFRQMFSFAVVVFVVVVEIFIFRFEIFSKRNRYSMTFCCLVSLMLSCFRWLWNKALSTCRMLFWLFSFLYVLSSTFVLRLDALFIRNWCIYVWSLFRLYCIDSSRGFLHNDRISWNSCTFFRCDHTYSN